MIEEMPCGYGTLKSSLATVWHQVSSRPLQGSQLCSKSPADLHSCLICFKKCVFYQSTIIASWIRLLNNRCFDEHPRMFLHTLRELRFAPGWSGSIWKYLGALVRSTGVSGRFGCGFWTNLHLANAALHGSWKVKSPHLIPMGLHWLTGESSLSIWGASHWPPSSTPPNLKHSRNPRVLPNLLPHCGGVHV